MEAQESFQGASEWWEERVLSFYRKYPLSMEISTRLIESVRSECPEITELEIRQIFAWAHNTLVQKILLDAVLKGELDISLMAGEVYFFKDGEPDSESWCPGTVERMVSDAHLQGVMDEDEFEVIKESSGYDKRFKQ